MAKHWEVRSTAGAAATLALSQCLGVFLFHAFIYLMSRGEAFFYFWGGFMVLGFLGLEVGLARLVRDHLQRRERGEAEPAPATILTLVKWLLCAGFVALFVWLVMDYPLPTVSGRRGLAWLFLALSWGLAELCARWSHDEPFVSEEESRQTRRAARVFGAVGLLVLVIAILARRDPLVLYTAGMIGAGFVTMGVSHMLLQND